MYKFRALFVTYFKLMSSSFSSLVKRGGFSDPNTTGRVETGVNRLQRTGHLLWKQLF